VLIAALSADRGPRRDEVLISTIATLGRGLLLTVLAQYQLTAAHWAPPARAAMLLALAAVTLGQAWWMYRYGPRLRMLPMPATSAATSAMAVGQSR